MGADFGTAALRTSGSLLLVLGLIICLFLVVRRLRFTGMPVSGFPRMRLLGRLHLAPKRAVALVEVQDQWLVLGVGTESVTLLSRFPRPPESLAPPEAVTGQGRKGIWGRALDLARREHDEKV